MTETQSRFVYVTYIRTTQEKLWQALTDPEFNTRYWFGARQECAWTVGAPWRLVLADGRLADDGEVLEIDAPRRLVLRWRHQLYPEAHAEGDARCEMELEPAGTAMKLTVTHTIGIADSKLISQVGGGWPRILSNLKSLLETGRIAQEDK